MSNFDDTDYLIDGLQKEAIPSDFDGEIPKIWTTADVDDGMYLQRDEDPFATLREQVDEHVCDGHEIEETLLEQANEVANMKDLLDTTAKTTFLVLKTATIHHEGDEWVVKSKDGSKELGRHSSKDKALNQLKAIEVSKTAQAPEDFELPSTPQRVGESALQNWFEENPSAQDVMINSGKGMFEVARPDEQGNANVFPIETQPQRGEPQQEVLDTWLSDLGPWEVWNESKAAARIHVIKCASMGIPTLAMDEEYQGRNELLHTESPLEQAGEATDCLREQVEDHKVEGDGLRKEVGDMAEDVSNMIDVFRGKEGKAKHGGTHHERLQRLAMSPMEQVFSRGNSVLDSLSEDEYSTWEPAVDSLMAALSGSFEYGGPEAEEFLNTAISEAQSMSGVEVPEPLREWADEVLESIGAAKTGIKKTAAAEPDKDDADRVYSHELRIIDCKKGDEVLTPNGPGKVEEIFYGEGPKGAEYAQVRLESGDLRPYTVKRLQKVEAKTAAYDIDQEFSQAVNDYYESGGSLDILISALRDSGSVDADPIIGQMEAGASASDIWFSISELGDEPGRQALWPFLGKTASHRKTARPIFKNGDVVTVRIQYGKRGVVMYPDPYGNYVIAWENGQQQHVNPELLQRVAKKEAEAFRVKYAQDEEMEAALGEAEGGAAEDLEMINEEPMPEEDLTEGLDDTVVMIIGDPEDLGELLDGLFEGPEMTNGDAAAVDEGMSGEGFTEEIDISLDDQAGVAV